MFWVRCASGNFYIYKINGNYLTTLRILLVKSQSVKMLKLKPFLSMGERVWITMNGELYLRKLFRQYM